MWKVGLNSSPNASISVNSSEPNAMKTVQCAAPTTVHLSIRVWPSVSVSIVRVRRPAFAVRVGSAWPSLITEMIRRTARTTRTMETAVTPSPMMAAMT